MISRVYISNFRCARSVKLELTPLTVLVGPNSSGKTAILEALNPQASNRLENTWHHEYTTVKVRGEKDEGGYYEYGWEGHPERPGLARFHKGDGAPKYRLLRLRLPVLRESNHVNLAPHLQGDGSNLTNAFSNLTRDDQMSVARELCQLVPNFTDLQARPYKGVQAGHQILLYRDRWDPDVWYTSADVSDGTILLTAYLVLQYQEPLDLLAIEEPDRGLHPYLLGQLVSYLRKLATGEIGPRPIRIILATHSPELLNFLKPEEVRFLRIGPDGGVEVQAPPTDTDEWEKAFKEYSESLGAAWLSGGLGGVPGVNL